MYATQKVAIGAIILGLTLPALTAAQESALPQPKSEGAITYISGGIGSDEVLAMKKEQSSYPLSMVFSEGKRGAYLADVHVTVRDRGGKVVLESDSSGPIMLVKLPPGEYRVTAELRGKALHRSVKVLDKGNSHLSFNWPTDDKEG